MVKLELQTRQADTSRVLQGILSGGGHIPIPNIVLRLASVRIAEYVALIGSKLFVPIRRDTDTVHYIIRREFQETRHLSIGSGHQATLSTTTLCQEISSSSSSNFND